MASTLEVMFHSGLTPRAPCLWNTPPKAGGTHTPTPLWVYKANGPEPVLRRTAHAVRAPLRIRPSYHMPKHYYTARWTLTWQLPRFFRTHSVCQAKICWEWPKEGCWFSWCCRYPDGSFKSLLITSASFQWLLSLHCRKMWIENDFGNQTISQPMATIQPPATPSPAEFLNPKKMPPLLLVHRQKACSMKYLPWIHFKSTI